MSGGTLAMRVRREPGGIAVITVTGEVDIDQVSFIDAAGLGALVGAAHRADIHGGGRSAAWFVSRSADAGINQAR